MEGHGEVAAVAGGYGVILSLSSSGEVFESCALSGAGCGHKEKERCLPRKIFGIDARVTAIAGGGLLSHALTEDGRVFCWWANDGEKHVALEMEEFRGITAIAAGWWHSAMLSETGEVLERGLGGGGEQRLLGFKKVLGIKKVKAIAAGRFSDYALTEKGQVFAWGRNNCGQLGGGRWDRFQEKPRRVKGVPKAIKIAAGSYHLMVMTEDSRVFTFGMNDYGQLSGTSKGEEGREVEFPKEHGKVVNIAAGALHSLALMADGTVLAWGSDEGGEISATISESGVNPMGLNKNYPVLVESRVPLRYIPFAASGGRSPGYLEIERLLRNKLAQKLEVF